MYKCSNIPAAHTYRVYLSQLIRYSRVCRFPIYVVSANFYNRHHLLVNRHGISVSSTCPRIFSVCRNHNSILSLFMNYHRVLTRVTLRVLQQKLLTPPPFVVVFVLLISQIFQLTQCFCFSLSGIRINNEPFSANNFSKILWAIKFFWL